MVNKTVSNTVSSINSNSDTRFDPRLFQLIPHRPPMLLLNKVLNVNASASSSLVKIDEASSFYETEKGVPAWIGLEYMGQTAALIAGYQLEQGLVEPHLGFLLGTRSFSAHTPYYELGTSLKVSCTEKVLVGDSLATFDCLIESYNEATQATIELARASLSVLRRATNEKDKE